MAPADVEDDWVDPGSVYEQFRPIPRQPLNFPSVVVASENDPLLVMERAREFASAWGSKLEFVGPHLHLGSDAALDSWEQGRGILDRFLISIGH